VLFLYRFLVDRDGSDPLLTLHCVLLLHFFNSDSPQFFFRYKSAAAQLERFAPSLVLLAVLYVIFLFAPDAAARGGCLRFCPKYAMTIRGVKLAPPCSDDSKRDVSECSLQNIFTFV